MIKITEDYLRRNVLYPMITIAEYPIEGEPVEAVNKDDEVGGNMIYYTVTKIDTEGVDVATSVIGVINRVIKKRVSKQELLNGKWWCKG